MSEAKLAGAVAKLVPDVWQMLLSRETKALERFDPTTGLNRKVVPQSCYRKSMSMSTDHQIQFDSFSGDLECL